MPSARSTSLRWPPIATRNRWAFAAQNLRSRQQPPSPRFLSIVEAAASATQTHWGARAASRHFTNSAPPASLFPLPTRRLRSSRARSGTPRRFVPRLLHSRRCNTPIHRLAYSRTAHSRISSQVTYRFTPLSALVPSADFGIRCKPVISGWKAAFPLEALLESRHGRNWGKHEIWEVRPQGLKPNVP
jgi:hypothetical protein